GKKLNVDSPTIYGGTPHAGLKGTNTAYVITNTYAVVPFNTVIVSDPILISGTNLQAAYTMDIMCNLELFVAAAVAGNATFGFILYSGATAVAAVQKTIGSINADVHNDTFIRSGLPPNQVITLQAAC